jgi:hypothetical protein
MQAKDSCALAGNDSGTVCQPTGWLSGKAHWFVIYDSEARL